MVNFYSNNFPRELGKYRSGRADNITDLLFWANKNNGWSDQYVSLYGFEKWVMSAERPDYSSAIIDRIYWDLDPEDKRAGIILPDPVERTLALSYTLEEDGVPHWLRATGSGFDVYGSTTTYPLAPDRKKAVMYTIQDYYDRKAGIYYDDTYVIDDDDKKETVYTDSIKGDFARITRISHTKNMKFKGNDKRFCVFVSRQDIESGRYLDMMRANTSNRKSFVSGDRPIDLYYWEENSPEFINTGGIDLYEEGIDESAEFESDWFCVNSAMERCKRPQWEGNKGTNRERFLILTYMVNAGYDSKEALGICKKNFDPSVYNTMLDEGQLKNVYSNGLDFPSISTLQRSGRCNNCGMC